MNKVLKKYPVPITGLILGLAASGNLVQSHGEAYRSIFGIISGILFIIMVAKIFVLPKDVSDSLKNPVVASVFPTFSMALMILSTYIKPFEASIAFIIWIVGLAMHTILILWFTKKFVICFKIEQVFPSWFIVYVGIVVASVTGPAYKMAAVGQAAFWFGLAAYLILLPVVIYRVVRIKKIPEQALPGLVIFGAPASLLLAGYMNSFNAKNIVIVWLLLALSIIMYIAAIIMLFRLLKLKFYPSFSGFTFPLVISGIAAKLTNGFLVKSGYIVPLLKLLASFQEILAVAITIYVLIRYIIFLMPESKTIAA